MFRIRDEFHHFAHIPKCAGSAVELYLRDRFGPLAFLETGRKDILWAQRWSKISPQHLVWRDLLSVFPEEWISSTFAIVRNPLDRIISEFQYKKTRGTIPGTGFNEWIVNQLYYDVGNPFALDNHIRPQSDFAPEHATVFRLEDGLDAVVGHLDTLEGEIRGNRQIEPENVGRKTPTRHNVSKYISDKSLALIEDFYSEDFERFGYDMQTLSTANIKRKTSKAPLFNLYQRAQLRRETKMKARNYSRAMSSVKK